jgi:hypothetical protein
MLIVAVVLRARPELVAEAAPRLIPSRRRTLVGAAAACVGLIVVVAPFASSLPDGLERVAERIGFAGRAAPAQPAPLADYAVMPLVHTSPWLATVTAGAIGALVAFAVAWLVARALAAPARVRTPR